MRGQCSRCAVNAVDNAVERTLLSVWSSANARADDARHLRANCSPFKIRVPFSSNFCLNINPTLVSTKTFGLPDPYNGRAADSFDTALNARSARQCDRQCACRQDGVDNTALGHVLSARRCDRQCARTRPIIRSARRCDRQCSRAHAVAGCGHQRMHAPITRRIIRTHLD